MITRGSNPLKKDVLTSYRVAVVERQGKGWGPGCTGTCAEGLSHTVSNTSLRRRGHFWRGLGSYVYLIGRAGRFSAERRVSCRLTVTVPVLVPYESLHIVSDVHPQFPSPCVNNRSQLKAYKAWIQYTMVTSRVLSVAYLH
jgi:hypothetical protein